VLECPTCYYFAHILFGIRRLTAYIEGEGSLAASEGRRTGYVRSLPMAVSAVSNSLATALQAFRPEMGKAPVTGHEKAKGSEDNVGTMPRPSVNSSGQTTGTTISTTA